MKIPFMFYLSFWFKGSFAALVTGFLLTICVPPLFVKIPYFGFIGVLVYQIFIYRFFKGGQRGNFEYKYKESKITKMLNDYILDTYGLCQYVLFIMDNFNQFRSTQSSVLKKILNDSDDNKIKFATYLKLAEVYSAYEDLVQEGSALKNALEIEKNNIIPNLRMAAFFERDNKRDEAIERYEIAYRDTDISSEQLKKFIREQIDRVKIMGPRKKPPMPGLRYVTW